MTKKTSNRSSSEVRPRAVRMVLDHGGDRASQWSAIGSVAAKIGFCGRPGPVQEFSRRVV